MLALPNETANAMYGTGTPNLSTAHASHVQMYAHLL